MQALQTLSQREFEMMQCFWEADEPLKMKELQTRWAHGETPQSRSTTLIMINGGGNELICTKRWSRSDRCCIIRLLQKRIITSMNCVNFRNAGI